MNRRPRLLWLLVLPGALAAVAASSTDDPARRTVSWDRYRVLSERNIFARDRGRRPTNRPVSSQPAIAINPDKYLALTGIGQDGREGVAFVEDTRSRKTVRVRTGDPIGQGRLVKITLDYVEYQCKGSTTRIEIGSRLDGSRVSVVPTTTAPSTQPGAAVAASRPGDATDAGIAAILERMRRRREQETGR